MNFLSKKTSISQAKPIWRSSASIIAYYYYKPIPCVLHLMTL
jgi:hypothetical protein